MWDLKPNLLKKMVTISSNKKDLFTLSTKLTGVRVAKTVLQYEVPVDGDIMVLEFKIIYINNGEDPNITLINSFMREDNLKKISPSLLIEVLRREFQIKDDEFLKKLCHNFINS